MKILGLILLNVLLLSCHPDNKDFNPFNQEFKFHCTFKLSDYDTIAGECGYWNLTHSNMGLKTYYQFYINKKDIVAKGFQLDLDTIQILDKEILKSETSILDLIKQHPIDKNWINKKLQTLKIKDVQIISDSDVITRIKLIGINDSVYYASIVPLYDESKIVRRLDYFNPNNK